MLKNEITKSFSNNHSFCWIFFCGGEVDEDIHEHLSSTIKNIPDYCIVRFVTLLGVLREFARENTTITTTIEKECQFNINEKMSYLSIE